MSVLNSATSIRAASDVVLIYYEAPASKDEEATQAKRASYGQKYYDKYASGQTTTPTKTVFKPYTVKVETTVLNIRKSPTTASDVVGAITDSGVYTIVEESTGTGASKWGRLKSGVGWISLDYVTKLKEV